VPTVEIPREGGIYFLLLGLLYACSGKQPVLDENFLADDKPAFTGRHNLPNDFLGVLGVLVSVAIFAEEGAQVFRCARFRVNNVEVIVTDLWNGYVRAPGAQFGHAVDVGGGVKQHAVPIRSPWWHIGHEVCACFTTAASVNKSALVIHLSSKSEDAFEMLNLTLVAQHEFLSFVACEPVKLTC
jgi:hypothetical protein